MQNVHRRKSGRVLAALLVLTILLTTFAFAAPASSQSETEPESNKSPISDDIVSITPYGFVDADGGKLQFIAVQYTTELSKGTITTENYAEYFKIGDYCTLSEAQCELIGTNPPGSVIKAYVNDTAAMSSGDGADGCYVIFEVAIDYQLASVPSYDGALSISVEQIQDITAANGTTLPHMEENTPYINYSTTERYNRENIFEGYEYHASGITRSNYPDLAGFKLYTLDGSGDGAAFHATNCFDEETGKLTDVDLPYALYVPEGAENGGKYGLVLEIENAGFLGTDPMIVITESKAAVTYASAEMQAYAKQQGLDGLIVVCPQIPEELRTTRDNWSTSAGVPATWQLLDNLAKTYNIDPDHIYGTGESMGGMQVLCMAAQRDNYFAGLWLRGCQWGSCYNLEQEYQGQTYYSSNDKTIWRQDADGRSTVETNSLGQEVIARNLYYLVSDDNILVNSCTGDDFATGVWTEFWYLFNDIGGVKIPIGSIDPLKDDQNSINAALESLLTQDNGRTNIHWMQQDGGNHMLTWVYADKMDPGYVWLVSQSRASEQGRDKIAQFANAWAAETDQSKVASVLTDNAGGPGRICGTYEEESGNTVTVYYAVPAAGAGTSGYNSYWSRMGKPLAGKEPGWVVTTGMQTEPAAPDNTTGNPNGNPTGNPADGTSQTSPQTGEMISPAMIAAAVIFLTAAGGLTVLARKRRQN